MVSSSLKRFQAPNSRVYPRAPNSQPKDAAILLTHLSDPVVPLLRTLLWLSLPVGIQAGIFSERPQHCRGFTHCLSDLPSPLLSSSLGAARTGPG